MFRSISERFNIAKSSLSAASDRVIRALNIIAPTVISWPDLNRMGEIEEGFKNIKGISKIIGAVDGTYIKIDAPSEYPRDYINRKMYHSVTLQAICEHNMKFIDIFAGYPSSVHDCRIFRNSIIYQNIKSNYRKFFPNGQFILGDKAYPNLTWCIVPYKDNGHLTDFQKRFNQCHSSTRQIIERSFALLFGRFRRLKHLQMKRMDLIPQVVMAACVLHNLCLDNDDLILVDESEIIPSEDRNAEPLISLEENSHEAHQKRESICQQLFSSSP